MKTEALFFRIGRSTAYKIIGETAKIIYNVLVNDYVKMPDE